MICCFFHNATVQRAQTARLNSGGQKDVQGVAKAKKLFEEFGVGELGRQSPGDRPGRVVLSGIACEEKDLPHRQRCGDGNILEHLQAKQGVSLASTHLVAHNE
eukprot:623239-Rhodomonas_salina.1